MKPVNSLQRSLLQAVRLLTVVALILSLGVAGSVHAAGPDLTIQVSNTGGFIEGGTGSTYTVTVSNVGDTPTSGLVTMDFNLNATYFTATAIGGTGWNCDLGTLTCTRSDALGGGGFSYPAITITVNVANDTPETVDNDASISGGGDVNGDNNVDFDTTNVEQVADLTIEKTHSPVEFVQGEQGAYTITVTNDGDGPTTSLVTVTEILPEGLTAVSFGGTGWSCSLATLICTRSDALAAGASYPAITLTVSVNLSANDPEINEVFVDGGGELNTANNNSVDVTDIKLQPDVRIVAYELLDANDDPLVGDPPAGSTFKVKLSVQNQGGADTPGVFYRSVYVDGLGDYMPGDPNDDTDYEFFSELEISTNPPYEYAGCLYYEPEDYISRGTFYTAQNFLGIPAGVTDSQNSIVEVSGLPTGSYDLYFYADPTCLIQETNENNNSFGPITVNVGGYASGPADVEINIGALNNGPYTIDTGDYLLKTFPGTDGRLFVDSINNVPIVSSIRLLYINKYGHKTLSELLGVTTPLLLDNYWMPVYIDNPLMDSQIRFTNTSATETTTVQVYIGGVLRGSYVLLPGAAQRIRYPNLTGGPVQIIGTPGVPILAGMRIIYGGVVGGSANSFDEIMAYPNTQLGNEYWFPVYFHNNANLDSELRIANTSSSQSSTVQVYIGPNLMGTYVLGPSSHRLITYPGVDGPVRIIGTTGVPLVASLRLLYVNKYGHKTLSELMGVPTGQLFSDYSLPTYIDNPLMDSQIRFTNTSSTQTIDVQVFLGNTLMGTYTLGPSSAQRVRYPGVSGGPVRIVTSSGVPILAGMRIIYGGVEGGSANSFDEIMAYPTSLLYPEYWSPIYFHNNANLDTEVRIGNP